MSVMSMTTVLTPCTLVLHVVHEWAGGSEAEGLCASVLAAEATHTVPGGSMRQYKAV